MKTNNPWDLMSKYFDTTQNEKDIPSGAADNILIAWPVFLRFIQNNISVTKGKSALDYGCGVGSFAYKLNKLGFSVTGIDSSYEMIRKAMKAYGKGIRFSVGDSSSISKKNSLITSIMTLQFIKEVEKTIREFADALIENGYLIFAVHNPEYIDKNTLNFETGVEVRLFIRTAKEYNALAAKYKLKPLIEEYPPFNQKFIEKYPEYKNKKVSEYMILGYKKEIS